MNQINIIITKQKNKHLSAVAIEGIIRSYNNFMVAVRTSFRATHKNHHLLVPKRNINKTQFLKGLAAEHGASLATIYNIINSSRVELIASYKTKIVYSSDLVYNKRISNKPKNHLKVDKAKVFIDMVINRMRLSKFNSIDETVNDLKLNNKELIQGLTTVCSKTIYNYVHGSLISLKPIDLPRMLRRKPNLSYKMYTPKRQRGTSIDERPFEPEDRAEFGHWEGDLVTGPRDGVNGAFLTLLERKTRFYYMIPIKNKKSKTIYMTINRLNKLYGDNFSSIFKSITFDNGAEFARYKDIEHKPNCKKPRTKVYFAHPYASSERGSNEIANQLIRYYIPKGTDINTLTIDFIKMIQTGINNKKRKILGYQSSESFFKNILSNELNVNLDKLYLHF